MITVVERTPSLAQAEHLLGQTTWAHNRPSAVTEASLRGSRTITAWHGLQCVAMARLITDNATFAYLCDVVVDTPYRGQGIAKALMAHIMQIDELQAMRRISLLTGDAHALYRPFGFTEHPSPGSYMQVFRG